MPKVPKSLGVEVARKLNSSSELDAIANGIAKTARTLAAAHVHTGDFESSIHVENRPGEEGVVDRYVVADDPNAMSIEYGHQTSDGTWVAGLHTLSRASKAYGGSTRRR